MDRPSVPRTALSRGMNASPSPSAVPILRAIALRDGYSDLEIQRLRRAGIWASIRRGSYLPTAALAHLDQQQQHALLIRSTIPALSVPAVVSHTSAAILWGIPLWAVDLDRVHVNRDRPASSGRSGQLIAHSAALDPAEIVELAGINVTSVPRTVADLARTLPFEQAVVAVDGALHKKLLTPQQLTDAVERIVGTPGSRSAMRVAKFANGCSESVGESRSRVLMRNAGLPAPELQTDTFDQRGTFLGRSDFSWSGGRVLGEFDGKIKYGRLLQPGESPGDAVFREKVREDALRDTGARVVRWVWAELEQPAVVVTKIRRHLAAAS